MTSKKIASIVLKRDKFKCRVCSLMIGEKIKFNIHHIIPKAVGGKNELNNLALLCEKCHKEVPHITNINFKLSKEIYNRFLKALKQDSYELNEGQRDNLFTFIQKEIVKKRFYNYVKAMKSNKELTNNGLIETTERLLKEQPEIFDALLEFEKTGRVPKFNCKLRYSLTPDFIPFKKFRAYCEKKGIKMSTRIEQHIREDCKV